MQRALCISVVALLAGAHAVPRRGLDIAAESDAPLAPPPPGPQQPPAPTAPATNGATHPLTVLPQYQLDGLSPTVQRSVVELVSRGLQVLAEAVHLPGSAPAPLLLPRSCEKVREWARRDGGPKTQECIKAAPTGNCLEATHNASLFGPVTVCAGERPGNCRVQTPGGTPVSADLVLYITSASGGVASCGAAISSSSSSSGASALLAAAGGACETDTKSGRPVAGAINLCPGRVAALSSADTWSADALVTDFLHEMMHVLAFSEGLYRFFPSEGAGIAAGPDGALLVSSPAVLGVARQHFACPTLRGVPLETEGGSGTARTHWRLRVLNGELMVGTVLTGQRPRLSNFTLAFLQDTGWYAVNYSAAERLTWGAGAGCAFVTASSCAELASTGFFCSPRAGAVFCTSDHQAVGSCSPLPLTKPDEQCFAVIPYSNWLCRDAALQNADRSLWGYRFGPGARCIAAGVTPWSRADGAVLYTQDNAVPGCFATCCNASGALFVSIDDVQIACPQGQRIELSSVKGLRFRSGQLGPCPPAVEVCSACPNDCSGNGDCSNGACRCWPGFKDKDCSAIAA